MSLKPLKSDRYRGGNRYHLEKSIMTGGHRAGLPAPAVLLKTISFAVLYGKCWVLKDFASEKRSLSEDPKNAYTFEY